MRYWIAGGLALAAATLSSNVVASDPSFSSLRKIGEVSERYQAYNIEMVEITGGRFWAPYGGPAGEVYRQRPPIDLTDPRLINLARQLGPSLLRVSGTWANNTYLPASGETAGKPPAGFHQILTRDQWRRVVAFSRAVDAPIVTSFAASDGTRDAGRAWTSGQAQRLLDLTYEAGGKLFAAEFFNEPNVPGAAADMPRGYTAKDYGRDFRAFAAWARHSARGMKIVGPGSIGESAFATNIPVNTTGGYVRSEDMMRENPGSLDAVSYHFYGSLSQRCAAMKVGTARKEEALTPAWLDRTLKESAYYSALRDRYEPGEPLWVTETAEAACGGSPWAATFLDTFRYLNQLGALAQNGVQVVMHNTLAASDYALLDPDSLAPRPNYWAAVLWHRTMGSTVLQPPRSPSADLRLYAHCLPGRKGGVGVAALNTSDAPLSLGIGQGARRWVLTGQPVDTGIMLVNGARPRVGSSGDLLGLKGLPASGRLSIPARSIAFVAIDNARNPACR